jgi:tetratricopeptide (TPR) repeat protein
MKSHHAFHGAAASLSSLSHKNKRIEFLMAKKRRKGSGGKRSQRQHREPIMHDRRIMEKQLSDIGKLLAEHEFESIEEMNEFLTQLLASGEPLPTRQPETPQERAQELMYQAFEAYGRKRTKLARKALKIDEGCTDAYVLLAEEAARTPQEALDLYQKGLDAAERTLGPDFFTEHAGHFWGIMETRPYMRARAGLAGVLWETGKHDEAIDHLRDLLRLNPNDNQGLRYFLATSLLHAGHHKELARLLKSYDEGTAYWSYTAALLSFEQKGDTARSTRALQQALEANPHVPDYLLGQKRLPRQLPDFVGLGDENEAIDYVSGNFPVWLETPGALAWLASVVGDDEFVKEWEPKDADEANGWIDEAYFDSVEHGYFPFEFDSWADALEIPKKERAALRRCLRRGVGVYSDEFYGRDHYKRESQDIIDEQLEVPYVFGYAATEILEDDKISAETKEKVVEYALLSLQPAMFLGIPYGLMTMLGFLAQRKRLFPGHLLLALLALETNARLAPGPSYWTEGVTSPAMAALAGWIAATEDLDTDEKLWLAWKMTVSCDSTAHLGKAFAKTWFEHPGLPDTVKSQLCWSWLKDNREIGTPHPVWQLMQAYMKGELDEIKRIKETYQLELDELPLSDIFQRDPDEQDSFTASFHEYRHLYMSPYLKRLAIPTLVGLGEDLHEMIELFWGHENDYLDPIVKKGVGDAIVEFHDRLEPQELRRLIERGIRDGSAQVRKPFYLFSTNFYGDHYLHQALDDNAASIRRWAAKKLKKNN